MATNICLDELKDKILDITLIDVRDNFSYKYGHIQGAKNIPIENLEEEFKKKYSPEKKHIVIYGEDEQMGEKAIQKLENIGYHNIELYKDGFQEWRHSSLPIKRIDLGHEKRETKQD